ncbi:MAG: GT4 family glycosyltransferase PelF [Planctomycetota bacterium]|jgi:glycosyltransferase involved in cell wall biosynthesis|nr:GT4 family glycosyltransferase PelF [Planctomycetota bacterium]
MIADVCILTEGTYPYVMGGVSTWIAQLFDSMPQITFSVLHIGASRNTPRQVRYKLPQNLVDVSDVFLFDYPAPRLGHEVMEEHALSPDERKRLLRFYLDLTTGKPSNAMSIASIVSRFRNGQEFIEAMAHSASAWEVVTDLYKEVAPNGLSFLDFYWTVRALFLPVLNLLRFPIPKARVYHCACTGYAGLLGARAAQETGRPFILSEHGIYSRERRIELSRVEWLSNSGASKFNQLDRSRNWFREWWIQLFQSLARSSYVEAAKIISLYQGNKDAQVVEGAVGDRIDLIPNGIVIERFKDIPREPRKPGSPLRIGFVGRVTSIKDIKTLLKSMAILASHNVPFETKIVGPMDEEPEYTEECLALTQQLDLSDRVVFTGPNRDLKTVYSWFDVTLLTSVSEGFPFVIIEANCAGIPVVTTDVGACKEIVAGMGREDLKLGPSGLVTAVGAPDQTAAALEKFALDPDLNYQYGMAGRERALRFYDLRKIMAEYQDLYETYIYAANGSYGPNRLSYSSS